MVGGQMRQINSYELARQKTIALQSFNDLCDIHVPNQIGRDSFGQNKKTFTTTANVSCGFNPSNTEKTSRGQLITEDCDAILRLPLEIVFHPKYEVTVSGVRFKVKGITLGKTVKRIKLIRMDADEQTN
jgi:hypothetical protein